MTDRYKGLIVAFEKDIRDDDCQPLISAIRQLKGVSDVTPLVANIDGWIAESNARHKLLHKISELLNPPARPQGLF